MVISLASLQSMPPPEDGFKGLGGLDSAGTLHIRCGTDICQTLANAGFRGDFLCFADPFIQGPVARQVDERAFIRQRSEFVASVGWASREASLARFDEEYGDLANAHRYRQVLLWFEHDAYDMLALMKILHHFHYAGCKPEDLRYVCVSDHPETARFIGLGQLSVRALQALWDDFSSLGDTQIAYAARCWDAYIDGDAAALLRLVTTPGQPLPCLQAAVLRQLQQLPWLYDGLNLTERLALAILRDHGPQDAATMFYQRYTKMYEPLPFMGDNSFWLVLDKLANAAEPAIQISAQATPRNQWIIQLTPWGEQLLDRQAHWRDGNGYDDWWGGLHNLGSSPITYWNSQNSTLHSE